MLNGSLRVCLVRERSRMECHGSVPLEWVDSVPVFDWGYLMEWNGYVSMFGLRDIMK